MTFEKFFQNTTLRQNTGKETERTEVFDFGSENFQNFHKIHLKETEMKSFFSEALACNFIEKELHHSYFPMS